MIGLDLFLVEFLLVDGTPAIDDVGEDEGNEEGDVEHGAQRELAAAGVADGERRLQVGGRWIVGGAIPPGAKQECQHDEHGANAGRPDAADVLLREDGLADAEEYEHNAYQQQDEEIPHLEEVVEILQRLHRDDACLVVGKAVLQQEVDEIDHEEHDEGGCIDLEPEDTTATDVLVGNVIDDVEDAQGACQEHYGKAEDENPGIEQRIEAVRGIAPVADDGCQCSCIHQIALFDHEVRAFEEGRYSAAQQQWADDAVEEEEELEGAGTKEVANLVLELVADRLQHEGEEDDHPQPIGSAERGGIEEGEGGKEGTTKGDEGGEGEFPLASGGIEDQTSAFFGIAQTTGQRVCSLYEEQEDE